MAKGTVPPSAPSGTEGHGLPKNIDSTSAAGGNAAASSFSVLQLLRIIERRKWIAIPIFVVVVVLALLYALAAQNVYESFATLDIDAQSTSGGNGLADLVQEKLGGEEANTRYQTQMRIMQSNSVLEQVAKELDLAHKQPFAESLSKIPVAAGAPFTSAQRNTILGLMRQASKFSLQPGTSIVQVTFRSPDPKLARDVPNAVLDTYISKDLGSGVQGTRRVSEWLDAEMLDLRKQVEQAQQKLAMFQQNHNIIGLDESQNILVDRLRLLNEQLTSAESDRITKEAYYKIAQTRNPELLGSVGGSPNLQILRGQEMELKTQYDDALSRYGSKYPKVGELKNQLDTLESAINVEIQRVQQHFEQDYLASRKAEDGIRGDLEQQKQEIYQINRSAAEYAMLRHDAEATRSLYDAIQYKLKETGIMGTIKSTQFRIVDDAALPDRPVAPRRAMIIGVASLAGLFLACLISFIVDSIDDAIYSFVELEQGAAMPILGAIPHLQSRRDADAISARDPSVTGKLSERALKFLVDISAPTSSAAEAFRGMRSSMLLGFVDKSPQLQLITSSSPGEGKSFVSCNYAITLAQGGARVLLVDTDLRRGTVNKKFEMPVFPGLTNILSERDKSWNIDSPIPALPNLFVLPSGPFPPNPAELLNSDRMAELLEEWRRTYDYVIMDSAPLVPVADTFGLAAKSDLVVMIARVGSTHMRVLLRMLEMLKRVNAPIGGIIVNDVQKNVDEYRYYYGNYTYGEASKAD